MIITIQPGYVIVNTLGSFLCIKYKKATEAEVFIFKKQEGKMQHMK